MNPIETALADLEIGQPQRHRNLTMFSFLAEIDSPRGYLTLDEALGLGGLRITEISEDGHVPELRLENATERSVLLLDGEELIGAKQNRVLNLTVLAPSKRTITIPVSCVEAGRWGYRNRNFEAANRTQYARGRARKMASVSESLNVAGIARSDQRAVWDDIASMSCSLCVDSPTSAMADLFDNHHESVEDYVNAFAAEPNQVGALFAIGRRIVGLDLFDHPETLARMLPKLVRSYALDAIERPTHSSVDQLDSITVETFLNDIATGEAEIFESVGEGHDVRIRGRRIVAGALSVEDKLIHLAGFRVGQTTWNEAGDAHTQVWE